MGGAPPLGGGAFLERRDCVPRRGVRDRVHLHMAHGPGRVPDDVEAPPGHPPGEPALRPGRCHRVLGGQRVSENEIP